MENMKEIFAAEARELLDDIERSLLELEERPNDMELINRIFRGLHTIKGSGKMFEFDELADFTHDLETTYDAVREGSLAVSHELVSLTLNSCDVMACMVNGDSVDLEEKNRLISGFQSIHKKDLPGAGPDPSSRKVLVKKINQPNAGPAQIYRIRFKPEGDIFHSGTDPVPLLNELRTLGECTIVCHTEAVPAMAFLNAETCYLFWDILLTTNRDEDAIRDVFIFVEDQCELIITILEEDVSEEDSRKHGLLGQILVEKGDLEPEKLNEVLEKRSLIGTDLIRSKLVGESKVTAALAEQQHVRKLRSEQQKNVAASSVRVAAEKLDYLVDLVGELVIAQARLTQHSSDSKDPVSVSIAEEIERLTTELRDNTMGMRMVPIGATFSKFKRLVRDLAKELGKEIALEMQGEETELDKTVIEQLNDPLVHIIRNSVDHGIELPAERKKLGKDTTGTIRLIAEHCGAEVRISIIDDGAGLDPERIRIKAIEKGLLPPDSVLADHEIYPLVFEPGFSTAQTVSAVSGRGVGMDVVKRGVESLRGVIEIASSQGQGTTIVIKLPLTLAIIDGLLVQTGQDMYVIPQAAVIECFELTRADSVEAHGNNTLNVRGKMLPYVCLRQRFAIEGEVPPSRRVILCEVNGKMSGLAVDRVIGSYQTVIKPLNDIYKGVECISGATILGDGTVALILDPVKLMVERQNRSVSRKTGSYS